MKSIKQKIRIIFIGLGLLIILSFNKLITLITDLIWFDSIGYQQVLLTRISTKLLIFIPLAIVLTLLFRHFFKHLYMYHYPKINQEEIPFNTNKIKKWLTYGSVLLGIFLSSVMSNLLWLDFLKFINRFSFGIQDPVYSLDISFYVFVLPFFKAALFIVLILLTLMVIFSLLIEILLFRGSYSRDFYVDFFRQSAHLISGIFLAFAGIFFTRIFDLLYSARGVAFGASYTDTHVTLWALLLYSILALVSALLIWIAHKKASFKLMSIGPIALIGCWVVLSLSGFVVQKLVVEPDEITKETQYIEHNIAYTQIAYNLNAVDLIEFPYEENLTLDTINANNETIKNIRINDSRPLLQTFNQIQSIRLYYNFNDIDIDRYMINDEYTQVFITARELDQYRLDNKAMTWINQYLKYTHGYGIVMAPVNKVTNEGQPELLFKNIPPTTNTDLTITRPEIYFGEQNESYIIVNTDEKEFDYPSGSDNVETTYSADTGIKLTSFNKFLFSIKEGSLKLLVSNNIQKDSRIILKRNILDRVKSIAPFLSYDSNPYIVVNQDDGKLYWIIDAYTTTRYYPYSQSYYFEEQGINYIRNSVKVVIDAYDGSTDFYIFDEEDPIIKTYASIFNGLFKSKAELPVGLDAHIRYPQDYFDLQANVYQKYHVNNPVVFYNGEDIWDLATEKYMDNVQTIQSNYVMFKIDEKAEFALILPYTPKGKPNMTSLLVARNDGEHYGEVFLYRFPKNKTVQGPIMIESRIDQDSVISPQFTLWGQQGSSILRGNVIVVPIENSLLYVEPIYIQSDNADSLPEMKRVIIAYGDKIVMEQNLKLGLEKLFGSNSQPSQENDTVSELLNQIQSQFDETQRKLDDLKKTIDLLEQQINP